MESYTTTGIRIYINLENSCSIDQNHRINKYINKRKKKQKKYIYINRQSVSENREIYLYQIPV